MGRLRGADGRVHTLGPRTVLGRSADADVQVRDPRVSGVHAALRWHDGGWHVRDLGSRNGTAVDGVALVSGADTALGEGAVVRLGGGDSAWVLVDPGPPVARAVSGLDVVVAETEVLLLPDPERPEASVYRTDGLWCLDQRGGSAPVADGAEVEVAGRVWALELPVGRALSPTLGADDAPSLAFRVSFDEEYVELDVFVGERRCSFRPRSFNYLLLTLARLRVDPQHRREEGWITRPELARMLRVDPSSVDVAIHRARAALGREVPALAGTLFETRFRTGQIRLGPSVRGIAKL